MIYDWRDVLLLIVIFGILLIIGAILLGVAVIIWQVVL